MAATITSKLKLKIYLFIYTDSAMISVGSTTSHPLHHLDLCVPVNSSHCQLLRVKKNCDELTVCFSVSVNSAVEFDHFVDTFYFSDCFYDRDISWR